MLTSKKGWIPAFAGMTELEMDSPFCRSDGSIISQNGAIAGNANDYNLSPHYIKTARRYIDHFSDDTAISDGER